MVRSLLILAFFWIPAFAGMTAAFATPPSEVKLTYNAAGELLHVAARHPSDRLNRHYLRMIVLYKNGEKVNTVYYPMQRRAWGLEDDIPVIGEEGDALKVEITCSQGGKAEAELTVGPPAENPQ